MEENTTNCAVCGIDTGSNDMLCDDCHAAADKEAAEDAAHDKFVDDCYNADYDESMML